MIGACEQGPTINSLWGGGSTVTAAHELVHAMGAVPRCAPHVKAGHATDSVNDLMFAGAERGQDLDLQLDVGRDDYYDAHHSGCADIADHPAWIEPG